MAETGQMILLPQTSTSTSSADRQDVCRMQRCSGQRTYGSDAVEGTLCGEYMQADGQCAS